MHTRILHSSQFNQSNVYIDIILKTSMFILRSSVLSGVEARAQRRHLYTQQTRVELGFDFAEAWGCLRRRGRRAKVSGLRALGF